MLNNNIKKTINKIKKERKKISGVGGVYVNAWTQTPLSINDVLEAIKDLGEYRDFVIKTILAVYVSTFLEKKDPVWLMLVGNPSSNKTTLVDLLKGLEDVYRLDAMTSNPFSSGQREKEKPKDLLPRLNNKCFIIKEYGTLFGRSDEMVKQLISDLVAIYDGEYAKHSPTRGTIRYEAYFSHIGCVTPMSLSSRQRYMNAVGARFLFLRIPPLSQEEKGKSLEQLWNNRDQKTKSEITQITNTFALQLKAKVEAGIEISFNEKIQQRLNNVALLMSRARGIVITEKTSFQNEDGTNQSHYQVVDKQVEEPFRALKQLKKLAQSLAIVVGKSTVTEDELSILRMITLSSMPVRRADILSAFKKSSELTAKRGAEILDKHYRTVKRNFDELVALEVLESEKSDNDKARVYSLKDEFVEILCPKKGDADQMSDEEIIGLFKKDELPPLNNNLIS